MTQTQTRGSGKASSDESSDDDESPSLGSGKPMTGGLLLRRPEFNSPQKGGDVELDNFVAREVSEWRKENSLQVLRQRKNISEHAMDEVIISFFHFNVPNIDDFVHSRFTQFLTAHSHLLVRTLSSTLLRRRLPALQVGFLLCLIHPFLHLPVRNFVHWNLRNLP
jgi:hypothetical protein